MSVTTVPHWLRGANAFQAQAEAPAHPSAHSPARAPASGIQTELVNLAAVSHCRADWDDLCARALEPSVFLESGFVLPAALHIAVSKRPLFLLVWQTPRFGAGRRLIGLCPIQLPGFARTGAARVWLSKQSCSGAPLLDKDTADAALRAMLDHLGARTIGAPALMFTKVPQAGKSAVLIRALAAATGRRLDLSGVHARAALTGGPVAQAAFDAFGSAKKNKELRRQRRRLADGAAVTFVSMSAVEEVRPAIEEFLRLEASGWKGKCGTAFLSSPGQAAFVRTLTRDLARQGKCRVDMLLRAGQPVAMGIVLSSADRAAFWKTTYDEDFAAQSPGVQLCHEISRQQMQESAVSITDSCAIADHPMIDSIWHERIEIADMLLSVEPGAQPRYFIALLRVMAAGRLRAGARHVFYRLSGRKVS